MLFDHVYFVLDEKKKYMGKWKLFSVWRWNSNKNRILVKCVSTEQPFEFKKNIESNTDN